MNRTNSIYLILYLFFFKSWFVQNVSLDTVERVSSGTLLNSPSRLISLVFLLRRPRSIRSTSYFVSLVWIEQH